VLATVTVDDPAAGGTGAFGDDAPTAPVLAEAGAGTPAPALPRPTPLPPGPCLLVPEFRRERLRPRCGSALWPVVVVVVVVVVDVVVVTVGADTGRGVAPVVVVVVSVGAGVGRVVMVVVVLVGAGAAVADCAPRAVAAPPIQPFSALEMARMLATSESRPCRPARAPRVRGLRCTHQTLGPVPER
jgi:hypothetical protein